MREGACQAGQGCWVAVVGAGVAIVELFVEVADAERVEPSCEDTGAVLQLILVARARLEEQEPQAAERHRMLTDERYRIPGEPSLPYGGV